MRCSTPSVIEELRYKNYDSSSNPAACEMRGKENRYSCDVFGGDYHVLPSRINFLAIPGGPKVVVVLESRTRGHTSHQAHKSVNICGYALQPWLGLPNAPRLHAALSSTSSTS
jgi:hypothetical protein